MEALSLSTVISDYSGLMVSPAFTIKFNDGNFGEVANIGNLDVDECHIVCLSNLLLCLDYFFSLIVNRSIGPPEFLSNSQPALTPASATSPAVLALA